MRIVVLVKQVPSTDKVKMDEKKGTMIRSAMEAELNPLDLYAVEEAVRVKEKAEGTEITVVSMGPPAAVMLLKRHFQWDVTREFFSLIKSSVGQILGLRPGLFHQDWRSSDSLI
jgi:hypothetical protein